MDESIPIGIIRRDSHVFRHVSGVTGIEFPAYLSHDAAVGVSSPELVIEDH